MMRATSPAPRPRAGPPLETILDAVGGTPVVRLARVVPPGASRPSRSAASIMATAMRSLTEPPGLSISILARRVG